jgi:hypothetical protein
MKYSGFWKSSDMGVNWDLTRQDSENGRIKAYELYISEDTLNWGGSGKNQ